MTLSAPNPRLSLKSMTSAKQVQNTKNRRSDSRNTPPPDMAGRDVWVFDLDNTLYPADCNLFPQIDVLMGRYIGDLLDVGPVEAKRVQKDYFVRYGTTLRGLMEQHSVDPHHFMDYVHAVDLSPIPAAPELDALIQKLPGRKLIYTNGSHAHAERVLNHLGLREGFDGIFDVADAGFLPKPQQESYNHFVEHFDFDPTKAMMIDDMARNLVPAYKMGMRTVWIRTDSHWGEIDHCEAHIDHETDDLGALLSHYVGD